MYDVAIVGSGPSGACAALKLAEAGASVILLDKKVLPRYKVCGGGVVQRARALLDFEINSVVEREFYAATITLLANNLSFAVQQDSPMISMTMRSKLDHLLVLAAQKAGAKIRSGTKVHSFSLFKTHIELDTTAGLIPAKIVIAADGAASILARLAGWKDNRFLVPAMETEIYLSDKEMGRYESKVRFDFDIPPHGYAWLFPKADHLSLGVLSYKHHHVNLKHALKRYLNILDIRNIKRQERHGFIIPASPRSEGFTRNRIILVGDAAGFADPVTCEGITFAIKSGQLAAESLIQESFAWNRCKVRYEQLIQQHILPELSVARFFSKILYISPKLRTWTFKCFGSNCTDVLSGIFAGKSTYRAAVANPINYLKLLKLRHTKGN